MCPTVSLVLSILVASSYVVAIQSFIPPELVGKERNDPRVVRHRILRVSMLCVSLVVTVPVILYIVSGRPIGDTIASFNLLPTRAEDFMNIALSLRLILVLYMGPIFDYLCNNPYLDIAQDFRDLFLSIYGVRDHIFAPLTEELIYRSIIISVLTPDFTTASIIKYSPILFGIAHIHHAHDLYVHKNIPLTNVVITVTFQMLYTSLFGILAGHIYVKYANIWCPIVIHAICNLMGFPALIEGSPTVKLVYYSLIATGIYFFYTLL